MLSKPRKSFLVRAFAALLMFVSCAVLTVGLLPSASTRAAAATGDSAGWNRMLTFSPQGFKTISAVDADNAWATDGSNIFRLTNGGNSWARLYPGYQLQFKGIQGFDADTAWTIGLRNQDFIAETEDNYFIKITGGGRSWEYVQLETTALINDLSAVDQTTAWAVGRNGTVIKTEDGGATWTTQDPGSAADLTDVIAVSPMVAWAISSNNLAFRTIDGGATWSASATPGYPCNDIVAAGGDNAWIAAGSSNYYTGTSSGRIYKTSDGGVTWTTQFSTEQFSVEGLSLSGGGNLWAAGGTAGYVSVIPPTGAILKTEDGGSNWVQQNLGFINSLSCISSRSPQSAWTGGRSSVLLRIGDTGGWGQVQCNVVDKFNGLAATNSDTAWFCGDQGMLAKVNNVSGGYCIWKTGVPINLRSIEALDADTAWTVGSGGAIFKTTDGGFSWAYQASGVTAQLNMVLAVDPLNIWAVGEGGAIVKSANGGTDWARQTSGTSATLNDISAVNQDTAWAVGLGGTILKTPDGGAAWQTQAPASTDLYGVAAADASTAWVVGGTAILKTSNGGAAWTSQSTGRSDPVLGISAVSAETAWCTVTGAAGTAIFATADGGAAWDQQYASDTTNETVSRIEAVDGMYGWALAGGQFIYTLNGGNKPPEISYLVPDYGNAGEEIIVEGENFGSTQKASYVSFGTVEATEYPSWSFNEIRVIIPAGLSGEVGLLSVTTPFGSDTYPFSTESPALTVNTISPASAAQGYVQLSINGNGFKNGMSVRLVQGDASFTATKVTTVSRYLIKCDFNLTGAPLGAYDVVITNPDGQQLVRSGGFNVTLPLACGTGATGTLIVVGGMVGLLSLGQTRRRRMRRRASKRS